MLRNKYASGPQPLFLKTRGILPERRPLNGVAFTADDWSNYLAAETARLIPKEALVITVLPVFLYFLV